MATRTTRPRPTRPQPAPPPAAETYADAFPHSTKVYVEGPRGIRVPMREIALSGGEPPLRVYDTSGPQGYDVRDGLPALRGAWIAARVRSTDDRPTHRRRPAARARPAAPPCSGAPAPSPSSTTPAGARSRPEMEFVGAPRRAGRRSSSGARWRAAAPSSRPTSTTPSSSR